MSQSPMPYTQAPGGFVVAYNPVPMANRVAQLSSRLRSRVLWTLLGAVVWSLVWWRQRDSWGTPWLLVAGYGVSLVLVVATVVRLLLARRALGRIGRGAALEASTRGLRLHALDGQVVELDWDQVRAVRAAGHKTGAGPDIVVETDQGRAWGVPLSFLDSLPGTIDGGVRALSGGRLGLDLRRLDRIV